MGPSPEPESVYSREQSRPSKTLDQVAAGCIDQAFADALLVGEASGVAALDKDDDLGVSYLRDPTWARTDFRIIVGDCACGPKEAYWVQKQALALHCPAWKALFEEDPGMSEMTLMAGWSNRDLELLLATIYPSTVREYTPADALVLLRWADHLGIQTLRLHAEQALLRGVKAMRPPHRPDAALLDLAVQHALPSLERELVRRFGEDPHWLDVDALRRRLNFRDGALPFLCGQRLLREHAAQHSYRQIAAEQRLQGRRADQELLREPWEPQRMCYAALDAPEQRVRTQWKVHARAERKASEGKRQDPLRSGTHRQAGDAVLHRSALTLACDDRDWPRTVY